jgi:hypothetical protein
MTIKSSGAISISDIKDEFGGSSASNNLSDYYKGGSYVAGAWDWDNHTRSLTGDLNDDIPVDGNVLSLADFYGAKKSTYWNYTASPVKSGYGYSNSATFKVKDYIPDIEVGEKFLVSILHHPNTAWKHINTSHLTMLATYGTVRPTLWVPQIYSKQWRMYANYDGSDTCRIGGEYCCKSTNSGKGGVFLRFVGRYNQ